jgi:hypothetical protein
MKSEADYKVLFDHLTSAMSCATRLKLDDLQFLLKMAVLEATLRHTKATPSNTN